MGKRSRLNLIILFLGVLTISLLCFNNVEVSAIKVMELMAPYKILSKANGKYLTAGEQGILGLTTGRVITAPFRNLEEQQWSMVWDPSIEETLHGYRLESKKEYLNEVTSYYPYESTTAIPNIWEVVEISTTVKQLKNKRTGRCLQIMKSRSEVTEKTCSTQNRLQHWSLQQLDFRV